MGLHDLSIDSEKNDGYLALFHRGDQRAMDFIYRKSFHNLLYFGKTLIKDEFLITCILHECYLKAWQHRERMESLPHIYRFIRMNLRWQILRHIEKSRHSIYGKTVLIDHFESTIGDFEDVLTDKESYENDIQNLERITQALKYLSTDAQQIASLHFKQGLNHKQIADRLGTSTIQVSNQIKKSVEQIKNMVHAQGKRKPKDLSVKKLNPDTESLNTQQTSIYQLRKIRKMSFGDIALKLGMNQVQVQQQYIHAHQLLKNQNSQQKVNRF
ncbi:RNA polymerase sigma factor [Dyadobacter frigoris]|uniref:Sigma-70 family RNA polymerase sigma factor n=1 Tax=Dyadobacter frigoris TaxID=2576211 RepID=A0A4U6D8I0_9BACT|nr:sigma-70 family RNA polymerase sigma factor [Dyadobacter frigoris]TKT92651.1 sigma-70 family RNA polymerase sigma factor [Dyadobacter frigoris]